MYPAHVCITTLFHMQPPAITGTHAVNTHKRQRLRPACALYIKHVHAHIYVMFRHRDCFKHSFHPVCRVCGTFVPERSDGRVEYKEQPFWRHTVRGGEGCVARRV